MTWRKNYPQWYLQNHSSNHWSTVVTVFLPGFEEVGCVSQLRYNAAVKVRDQLQDGLAALEELSLSAHKWRQKLPNIHMSENKTVNMTWVMIIWDDLVVDYYNSHLKFFFFFQWYRCSAVQPDILWNVGFSFPTAPYALQRTFTKAKDRG